MQNFALGQLKQDAWHLAYWLNLQINCNEEKDHDSLQNSVGTHIAVIAHCKDY